MSVISGWNREAEESAQSTHGGGGDESYNRRCPACGKDYYWQTESLHGAVVDRNERQACSCTPKQQEEAERSRKEAARLSQEADALRREAEAERFRVPIPVRLCACGEKAVVVRGFFGDDGGTPLCEECAKK